ncbi:MAG: lipoprotein [Lysobacterales bacterium]|jgi:predicted small lipoprotein YifL
MNIFRMALPDHDRAPRGPLLLACLLALSLSACGQRGPLFLPDSQPGARPPGGAPADGQSQDDDEQEDGGSASKDQRP